LGRTRPYPRPHPRRPRNSRRRRSCGGPTARCVRRCSKRSQKRRTRLPAPLCRRQSLHLTQPLPPRHWASKAQARTERRQLCGRWRKLSPPWQQQLMQRWLRYRKLWVPLRGKALRWRVSWRSRRGARHPWAPLSRQGALRPLSRAHATPRWQLQQRRWRPIVQGARAQVMSCRRRGPGRRPPWRRSCAPWPKKSRKPSRRDSQMAAGMQTQRLLVMQRSARFKRRPSGSLQRRWQHWRAHCPGQTRQTR